MARFSLAGTPGLSALIQFRLFRNSDAPLIAEVWRSQPQQRGLAQPMSAAMFEELVLTKSVFDREGLILACDDGTPLGFVHAGFGPSSDLTHSSGESGVISMLMLRSPDEHTGLAAELLTQGEAYLHRRGAGTIWAGGIARRDPFYLGLYGGSECCGILNSDPRSQQLFLSQGYQEVSRTLILHRDLARFRPVVDRNQMQIRRRMSLHAIEDPKPLHWWDACTLCPYEQTRFELQARDAAQAKRRRDILVHAAIVGQLGSACGGAGRLGDRHRRAAARFGDLPAGRSLSPLGRARHFAG